MLAVMERERPLVRRLARTIIDVARDASGLVALVGDGALDRLDEHGAPIARIATVPCDPSELTCLADGRFVVRPGAGVLHVVQPGAGEPTIERTTDLGELESFVGVIPHEDGYVAWGKRGLLFERGGRRRAVATEHWIDRALVTPHGALTWSWQGWFLVAPTGEIVLRGEEGFAGTPARIGDLLLAAGARGWVALDLATSTRVEPPPLSGAISHVCAVGGHFVCARGTELLRLDAGFAVVDRDWLPWTPSVLEGRGERLVAAIEGDARVGSFGALDEVPIVGRLDDVVAFGNAIALRARGVELPIWSPRGVTFVSHDAPPQRVRALGDALATLEYDVLRIHRPGVDHGPPQISVAAGPPIGETVVVDGTLGRRVTEGLVAYQLEVRNGMRARVARDAPFRAVIDAEAAARVLEILARRDFERAPLDEALATLDPWSNDARVTIASCHPERSVGLFLRGLFGSETSTVTNTTGADTSTGTSTDADPALALRVLATRNYDRFVEELAWALRRSALQLIAAIRAGRVAFDDALEVPGFLYLGTFECGGRLVVCDPCHRDKPELRAELDAAAKGTWHVLVREGVKENAGRVAELVAVHADGLAHAANQRVDALLGVDAGVLGIYDRECPMPNLDQHFETGPFVGRGAHSSSGWGDGGYVAYVARVDRRVVKVRVPFFEDGAVDRSVVLPKSEARTYSPRERFKKDELVAHPKFGVGRVVEAGPDRVEVAFGGERKTLVHGRA
jgi:hypothetical protein